MSTTLYESLSDIHADLDDLRTLGVDDAYRTKQLHRIPEAPVVDRVQVILEASRGKRVLHLGCGWPPSPLHQAIAPVASEVIGVDIAAPFVTDQHIFRVDLDAQPDLLPQRTYDVIIAGEILEHLVNPGNLLRALRRLFPTTTVIVSVPNAFSSAAGSWVAQGIENVNRDHTAWYSWTTLHVLVAKCRYRMLNCAWYGGEPYTAEGLVGIIEPEGA